MSARFYRSELDALGWISFLMVYPFYTVALVGGPAILKGGALGPQLVAYRARSAFLDLQTQ